MTAALVTPRHDCGYVGKPTTPKMAAYSLRKHSCAKHRDAAAAHARGLARHAAVDRTPQPCRHKQADHRHGTHAAYVLDRCRCLPCTCANSAYEANRTRQRAYGRESYVNAAPTVAHVRELMAAGVGLKRIVAVSGVSSGSLWKLVYGKKDAEGVQRPTTRCRAATAQKLLAVRADFRTLAGGARVEATGTHRRLKALVVIGWSQSKLSTELGVTRANFGKMLACPQVTARTARRVAELYDRLWDCPPPQTEWRERNAASRARNLARRYGWAPPLAWDDDTIDDPAAQPSVTELSTNRKSKLPPLEELQFLLEAGESIAAIASRFGVSEDSVATALRRAIAA